MGKQNAAGLVVCARALEGLAAHCCHEGLVQRVLRRPPLLLLQAKAMRQCLVLPFPFPPNQDLCPGQSPAVSSLPHSEITKFSFTYTDEKF